MVLRGTEDGRAIGGIRVLKTPAEGLGMDTVYTDSSGAFAFTDLPGGLIYHIQVSPPPGFLSVNSIPGAHFYQMTVEDPVTGALKHQELKKMVLLK